MSSQRTRGDLILEIQDLKEKLGTWQAVGDRYGVSKIVAWRIVNDGYEPKGNDVRRRLGLEEILHIRAVRDKAGRFQRRV